MSAIVLSTAVAANAASPPVRAQRAQAPQAQQAIRERNKELADFFHSQGSMSGGIDYQIAEGDLVATRWQWRFQPTSLLFRVLGGREQIPIINVFRFDDQGKIVEIWNHRHDIDTARGNIPFVIGLGIGLLFALAGWATAFVFWRRVRRLGQTL